ncbi:MAG: FAD-binding oxidoreductase [Clostridia bacterium]|nr:FAD-binding oxidoreductase [Clostridia bacterium]
MKEMLMMEGVTMLDKEIIAKLKEILGADNVTTDREDLVTYSFDATADMPSQLPDAVVTPETTEQIQAIVNLVKDHKAKGWENEGCLFHRLCD